MKERWRNLIEGVVTTAIILVLLQTVADDIMIMKGAPWWIRRVFLYTGFAFDLFFTIEFLARSWNAILQNSFKRYFVRENGWVDFIASVPLLIFTSGPAFLSLAEGTVFAGTGALLGMLKVVKAVRMARVLRILRLLKIFRRIRFADSIMVQRHTVRIITTAASALIFASILIGMMFAFVDSPGIEQAWFAEQQGALESLKRPLELSGEPDSPQAWGRSRPSVLLLKQSDELLYARHSDEYLQTFFGPGDFRVNSMENYTVWFDIRPAAVALSKLNLTIFISTLAVVLLIMVTYSSHFAITVSDPVNIMAQGMKTKSYNLEVTIPTNYARDDIFRLASAYNEEFLPLKERSSIEDQGGSTLDISLDDISDILKT